MTLPAIASPRFPLADGTADASLAGAIPVEDVDVRNVRIRIRRLAIEGAQSVGDHFFKSAAVNSTTFQSSVRKSL